MNTEELQEEIVDKIVSLAVIDGSAAIALITGVLIGLIEEAAEESGNDPASEIELPDCGRKITIHARVDNTQDQSGQ